MTLGSISRELYLFRKKFSFYLFTIMRISIIAAVAKNNAIGYDNQLIYHLPNDLKRFKELTTGNTIIMGRRTFESLPKGALPNRRNIVLSSQANMRQFPGADAFKTLQEAIFDCQQKYEQGDAHSREVYIIGGASVYEEAIDIADRLCLTFIDDTPALADTFFPSFEKTDWKESFREDHDADEKHSVPYSFIDLERVE